MKGDFTRFTFDPSRQYSGVRKQQGRVDLDADWNEAADIQAYLDAVQSTDVIGKCGTPKKASGFKVSVKPDGSDLNLSPGRLYVKGSLCTIDKASYLLQPNLPDPPALDPKDGRSDLVYLEVWQRHITAAEDPDLLEPALGGADTTTRLQTIWQVKVRQGVKAGDCKDDVGAWPPVPQLDKRGRLTTKVTTGSTTASPCLTAPGGGYQGLENRLYRVEIHDAGQPYTWPRPTDAVGAELNSISGKYKAVVKDFNSAESPWCVGQFVEVYSEETDKAGKAGTLARIMAVAKSTHAITLDKDISALAGHNSLKLRPVTTYKWSRDNGSIVFPIQEFVSGEPQKVKLVRLGRDQVLTLHQDDWVEVLGDTSELWGDPGTLASIVSGGIDEAEMKLTLSVDISSHKEECHPKVRRWDQKSTPLAVTTEEVELEDGIKIQFSGTNFQSGDYWCFAARTSTGEVEILENASPMGIERSFCKLAIVNWKENPNASKPWDASTVSLCVPTFPPLTDIWAEDVFYDDSHCFSVQAETVQEAIDQLCAQRDLPFHNKHLHGWGIVCGLKVVCGPEDLDEPGDQVSVIVKPGYALDCEGNDIVLGEEMQVAILKMIEEWEAAHKDAKPLLTGKDGKLSGQVSLIVERDEHGKPRLDLRPYDPSSDNLNAMLQGTLLMDFIQECVVSPLEKIREFLEKPTGDFDKGSIVKPQLQQFITVLNLIWQLFKSQYGSHLFLSLKEHTILENLYYKLAEILASQTFCGVFHETPFPDYPFPEHRITTLFGQDAYQRVRIHPGGELGYAIGTRGKIGVFDLSEDVLIEELTFGDGNAAVQDVAFSMDGTKLYAMALAQGGDSLFAAAEIEGKRHKWLWMKPVCGCSFLTLYNTETALYAIARDQGLFSMNPDQEVIIPALVGEGFHAVGHLVMDHNDSYAYASAAANTTAAMLGQYDRVVGINPASPSSVTQFLCGKQTGNDDIALSGDDSHLFIVVDAQGRDASGQKGNKELLIFSADEPGEPQAKVDLEANTVIRLLSMPGRGYLAISYEDCYWLRLLDTGNFGLYEEFHFPVQISPIGMAYGPLLEESGTEGRKKKRRASAQGGSWRVYVLNGISSTLTAFPETYLSSPESSAPSPVPGSAEFVTTLKQYRYNVLLAFLGLVGAVWQSLKDCLCDRFLVDCPACSTDDDVYLAKITIKDSEVYQVCNFSKRKYVKSFPTVDYWLSILPVMPIFDKVIEKTCCAILPNWFQEFARKSGNVRQVKDTQIRQTYALVQQQGMKGTFQKATLKANVAGRVASDWVSASLSQAVRPPMQSLSHERVVDKDIASVQKNMQAAGIEIANVENYDANRGLKNLQSISGAPANLRPGMRVTLYADNGVVRYYTLAEESSTRIETLEEKLAVQKSTLDALQTQTPAAEAVPTASSADLQALQAELQLLKEQVAGKDQELNTLRTKLETFETNQTTTLASMREQINRLEGRKSTGSE